MRSIQSSVAAYETFLRSSLGRELVESDLEVKHAKMRKKPFLFLRATCWRWAEMAALLCPDLMAAPRVLAVGDAHIENFGLWRDAESRLVWGVNDFDEAAETPYAFDLVRLVTSALLAGVQGDIGAGAIAKSVMDGYMRGLQNPKPFVLEGEHIWLRDLFMSSDKHRIEFWDKIERLKSTKPPARFAEGLRAALPKPTPDARFAQRHTGIGSRGLPRFVASGIFQGGPFAREAKALVSSCWTLSRPGSPPGEDALRAARGLFRAPDPQLFVRDRTIVRRLAPDSQKLEIGRIGSPRRPLLAAMGWELANIHAAGQGSIPRIRRDLEARNPRWLREAAERTADATIGDWKSFRRN